MFVRSSAVEDCSLKENGFQIFKFSHLLLFLLKIKCSNA